VPHAAMTGRDLQAFGLLDVVRETRSPFITALLVLLRTADLVLIAGVGRRCDRRKLPGKRHDNSLAGISVAVGVVIAASDALTLVVFATALAARSRRSPVTPVPRS
jgi:hypothetical protein